MDYNGNIIARIEDAVINAFPWAEERGEKDKLFVLDPRNFQSSFKKKIAEQINFCLKNDKSINLLFLKIADKVAGTGEEYAWLNIIAQNPLPVKSAYEYYTHLAHKRIERSLQHVAA